MTAKCLPTRFPKASSKRPSPGACGFVVCALGVLGLILGCASAPVETLLSVSGTVRVEGQLLTTGWITFYPDEALGNRRTHLAVAEIQSDGTYALSTNGRRGAPPGWYKVVVASSPDPIPLKPPRNPDGTPRNLRWFMHEKYTRPETTDLRIEVGEKPEPGRYDLHLVR